jgi:hypothetical protein
MMKTIILFICLLVSVTIANAQQNYDVSLIPKELLPYASAVVRDEEMKVEVEDLNSTIVHEKMAVTIFNKNGDHMAHIEVEHDKSTIIKNIKGVIYNEFGKQTGKFSEGDFDDASGWDGFSLFNDARVKHYFPSVTEYPYTIVYEYELRLKQSLNLPGWEPNSGTGVAVEKSSFTFICKPDFTIRYKENKIPEKAIIGTDKQGLKTYTWEASNLKALKDEPFSPYPGKYLSSVKIAPEKFEYEGIRGEYTNWGTLGKWEYDKLVADRQALPAETIEHIKEITKDIPDPKLKAKKIYEYMQGKTHYISVQVGIGGYQPFLASDVDKQNYGDCKALVNYTQALLKAVNIESYYCVVQAGRNYKVSFIDDFASMQQGDHIILCIPFKNDTTWADCTSETIPFGYLGPFTDDRTVLACTPEGGKLMHTPKYTVQDNLRSRKASFVINSDGQLSGTLSTTFKGADYEDKEYLVGEPKTEQVKMLQRQYPINNMDIESFDLKQDKSFDPLTTENIKLNARDYASLAAGKYYFTLDPINRLAIPSQVRNRVNNVYINRGYTDEDEIIYTIPVGYHLEKDPLDLSIDKPFAKFKATMQLKGNQLIYKRKFQVIDGTYSKDAYQDLVDFYQAVVDADEYNVVLVKNN